MYYDPAAIARDLHAREGVTALGMPSTHETESYVFPQPGPGLTPDVVNRYAEQGLELLYGNDVAARNRQKAVEYLKWASTNGHVNSLYHLGIIYSRGEGVMIDHGVAVKYFRQAVALGHAHAHDSLGFAYANGLGASLDDVEAAKYFEAAAALGVVNAMLNLAHMYATGRGVERDDRIAIAWYERAGSLGDHAALNNLGIMCDV